MSVVPGGELTPTQVKDIPSLAWKHKNNELYTLMMFDPDAPSRHEPTISEVRHWLVVNISGNAVNNGQTIVEYIGSGAPKGTGLHRYIFLVYRQNGEIDYNGPITSNRFEQYSNLKKCFFWKNLA